MVLWLRLCLPIRFDTWSGKLPYAAEHLSPTHLTCCSGTCESQSLSPCAAAAEAHVPTACVLPQEKPLQWEVCTSQEGVAPASHKQRKLARRNEDPAQPRINKYILKKWKLPRKSKQSLDQNCNSQFLISSYCKATVLKTNQKKYVISINLHI